MKTKGKTTPLRAVSAIQGRENKACMSRATVAIGEAHSRDSKEVEVKEVGN